MEIKRIVLGPFETNTYIIYSKETKESIIIDPSFFSEDVISFIDKLGLNVKAILLTHAHIDHTAGILKIKEKVPNLKVYMSEKEQKTLIDEKYNLSYLFSEIETCKKVDIFLKDNDILCFCETKFKVIETPGHTLGSVCYYLESEKILFTGDTLFYRTIGRSDFPGGNSKELIDSIKNKLFSLDNNIYVMPGHGMITSIGAERKYNPFLRGI